MDTATVCILRQWDALPDEALVKRPVVMALWGGISDEEVRRRELSGRLPRSFKANGSRQNFWRVGELRDALAKVQGKDA